jgi:pimeloyl-ACP methyl ester carboxylesterase
MPTADAKGVSLYYEESGTGKPVVFVHGIPTDYRAWKAQMEPFSKSRRAISLSRRYASPNKRDGDISDSTVQNNALDLKNFIETLGGPVDLVGHSYGGFASAFLAADHPDLVRSLVLVEPAVSTLLVADQTSGAQALGLLLKSPSTALSGRRFQTKSLKPSLEALKNGDSAKAVELNVDGVQDKPGAFNGLPADAKEMMLANARTIAELKTTFPRFTATEAKKISMPTFIVNGEMSSAWLRKIGELMVKVVPGSKRTLTPGSRHFPHMENPEFFNSNVLSFLEALK